MGDYTNDFVGVDTTLSLMFSYNGVADDDDYAAYGLAPAAVGYDFFAGPIAVSLVQLLSTSVSGSRMSAGLSFNLLSAISRRIPIIQPFVPNLDEPGTVEKLELVAFQR